MTHSSYIGKQIGTTVLQLSSVFCLVLVAFCVFDPAFLCVCSILFVQSLCMETAQTNHCSTAVPAGRRSTEWLSTGTGQRRLTPKTTHVGTVSVFFCVFFLPVCCQVILAKTIVLVYFSSWLDFSVPATAHSVPHIWCISSFCFFFLFHHERL